MRTNRTIRHPKTRSIAAVLFGYTMMLTLAIGTLLFVGALWPDLLPTQEGEEPGILLRSLLLIAVFSDAVIGGYLCALIAKRHEYQHGFAMVALIAIFGLLSLGNTTSANPELWYAIATLAAMLLGVLLGIKMRTLHKRALHESEENGEPHEHVPEARGFHASP